MRNLWRALKLVLPHRAMLFWYMMTAAGLAVFGSAPLVLLKTFLSKLEKKEEHKALGLYVDRFLTETFGTGRNYIIGLCILTLVFGILKAVFDFLNTYIASWLAQSLRMEAMERVMHRLLTLDQPFFDKQKSGDLVSRMVSDGDNLRRTVKTFLDFLQQPFTVLALVGLALYYNWQLFLIGALGVPIVTLPLQRIIRNISKQTKRYQEKTADLAQAMLQNLSGIRIIHAYDAAEKESQNFSITARSLFRTGMRRNWNRAMQRPLTSVVFGVGLVAVLILGGIQVMESGQDPNDFIVFLGALGMLYGPVNAMVGTLGDLAELLPSAERTFEILDLNPTIVDAPNATQCPVLTHSIVFDKVSFDYGRGPVLNEVSLSIRAGEKIGIVGRTGAGKSTLLALLQRVYDPGAGRILIDGAEIRSVTLSSLRSQMALVNQKPFLFHASVGDNIGYGRPGSSEQEIIDAAKTAMIHDEIMAQGGYQTLCGERGGELFSGGQGQRISVARAILRNAPILLLDEATSALDAFSERRVQEAIDKLVISRTSLIVAHRLSTLRNVDRIVVMGTGGGVEAVGTHQELLISSPTYRLLWNEQNGTTLRDQPDSAGESPPGARASCPPVG